MKEKKNLKIDLLFEDENFIVVNKPPQLLVIPDRWDSTRPALISILQDRFPDNKIYVVHRLDQDTSGVIMFAKTAAAHKHLNLQLQGREVEKIYFAIVKGEIKTDGIIDLAIDTDSRRKGRVSIRKKGKNSITEYQVLERFRGFTYVRVIPRTGRTHQIRVHLQAIGHPLAIDPLYGDSEPIYLSRLKRNYRFKLDQEERPLIDRLTLHAGEIRFNHPITGEQMKVSAELPKDIRALLNVLRKHCIAYKKSRT